MQKNDVFKWYEENRKIYTHILFGDMWIGATTLEIYLAIYNKAKHVILWLNNFISANTPKWNMFMDTLKYMYKNVDRKFCSLH